MGLYDTPLPPRPPPPKDDDDDDHDSTQEDDDVDFVEITQRLFEFDESGQEVRHLLPPLRRRLDPNNTAAAACYMEPTDRLVQNLVQKTSCHVNDACWALEACRGDLQEAWLRISTARRLQLNNAAAAASEESTSLGDYQLAREIERRQQKKKKKAPPTKRKKDLLNPPEIDQPWLPRNPKGPIDDEPWFTG